MDECREKERMDGAHIVTMLPLNGSYCLMESSILLKLIHLKQQQQQRTNEQTNKQTTERQFGKLKHFIRAKWIWPKSFRLDAHVNYKRFIWNSMIYLYSAVLLQHSSNAHLAASMKNGFLQYNNKSNDCYWSSGVTSTWYFQERSIQMTMIYLP